MNAGRSYLQISLFKPEDESHDLTEWDKKFLANSSFDEETKSDEETNDGSLAPQDDDGSGDEWSEYVDRGWKKHGHYDATEDIEGLEDVEWTCGGHYAGPTDLYEHEDNKDDTPVDELRISEEFKHLFKDPVKGFLAFMPLEFWKTVTLRTNAKAVALQAAHPKGYVGGREFKKSIELVEVMKFVGLLIMMSVVQGGEYSLYWSKPSMSFLMPPTENFGRVMPIDRFKQLRACITFNDVVEPADPLWRIRPLINLLKASFKNFVVAGREISVDEACIPCRSSYARALIVYNPKKPLGKYHFRIYTAACATTWYVFAFKIHSKAARNFEEADDDDDGGGDDSKVDPDDGAEHPRDEVKPSALRQHVIDITKQWEGSHRVINMDNWYSSVQLCLTLLKMGMYCRGTVRSNRAHNPRFGMFDKKQIKSVMRGSSLVSVATSLGIIAVSWLDGTVVNMLSTADATTKSYVHRRIGSETRQQECLSLVGLYNKYMQGVDRHDQLRERFSIASGASFKHWYKKLGFALVDIAITNLYVLYTLCEPVNRRDSHMHFQTKLANQMLFETDWTLFSETQVPMEYANVPMTQSAKVLKKAAADKAAAEDKAAALKRDASLRQPPTPSFTCRATDKQAEVSYDQRMRRYCVVCYFERNKELIKTQWCDVHKVYLCTKAYVPSDQQVPAHVCPHAAWSCWDKFHSFYHPKGLFKKDGKMDRGSELYRLKKHSVMEHKTSSAKKTLILL
ncbi:hypothetical protein DYB34_011928 [Aphanomyces astaci]|uniref:PiggyBac transposable element-derived protein domain-containing protein n=3 Tax=Aphanomyces astaci TaxID=112090 RepID=A0A3R6XEC5_APHAT|nr:hypothetical protein DYB34_011928 [Aphanomyces astaci]